MILDCYLKLASLVVIATRYVLNGPGMESRWGEICLTPPDRPWGPPSLPHDRYRVFPGGKLAGAWRWPTPPCSAEVKERVELYPYSTSGPPLPVLGWNLPRISPRPFPWISYQNHSFRILVQKFSPRPFPWISYQNHSFQILVQKLVQDHFHQYRIRIIPFKF
jgi:hypothetical protein